MFCLNEMSPWVISIHCACLHCVHSPVKGNSIFPNTDCILHRLTDYGQGGNLYSVCGEIN